MNWILAQTSQPALGGSFWMPPKASTISGDVDGLFYFIYGITVFFFLLVMVLMLLFVFKYRYRKGHEEPDPAPAHSTALELTWTVIPTVLVLMVFYFGFRGYLHMAVAPPNAYEINVEGKMWSWSFTYPNGYVDTELHIPINTPIRVVLQSRDVIHSLYIPQFRIKKDAVPGRYNRMWFEATQVSPPEGFDVYCAEYCGTGHSTMRTKVIVHPSKEDFAAWLEKASNWENRMTPLQRGQEIYQKNCTQCHSIDGTRLIGPSLKNVFGEPQTLNGGSTVVADENYIHESLYEPAAKVVAGFTPQMPSYKGQLKENDVAAVIQFLKSISDKYKNETMSLGSTTQTTASTAPSSQPMNR